MVVGDNLNMIVSPNTDTTAWGEVSTLENQTSARYDLRVGGAQIDTDGFAGHIWGWVSWVEVGSPGWMSVWT